MEKKYYVVIGENVILRKSAQPPTGVEYYVLPDDAEAASDYELVEVVDEITGETRTEPQLNVGLRDGRREAEALAATAEEVRKAQIERILLQENRMSHGRRTYALFRSFYNGSELEGSALEALEASPELALIERRLMGGTLESARALILQIPSTSLGITVEQYNELLAYLDSGI